jgi:sugar O-acyltransferase (sialic acid O-acetyltransferase NeuD family)
LTEDNNPGQLIIVGAGGHGREVFGTVHDSRLPCLGFADDQPPDFTLLNRIGARYLGTVAELLRSATAFRFILGIGAGSARQNLDKVLAPRMASNPIIHPASSVGLDVRMKPGSIVFANASVTTNIEIGRHTHIGRGAAIGHDTALGDFVTIMPLASVSGSVNVGDRATIGAGAVVRQGQTIGEGAFVGAGAVVVRDVAPGEVVVGNPAKPLSQ